jgi:alanine racemase
MNKNTTIATLSVGYADGYQTCNNIDKINNVLINNVLCNVVGNVSMDMLAVDVDKIKDTIKIGDKAQLWGEDINIKDVALKNNKSVYELMCLLTPRVPRVLC